MKLSIVIVNYNVGLFLDQCIERIVQSKKLPTFEIIVVDNNSTDGSRMLIEQNHPQVIWVQNQTNLGFSKANNLGFGVAKGEYILILNPDTLVSEYTISDTLRFAEQTENFGALGVKMLDGKGNFLKESMRGIPTLWSSFTKVSGLYNIFPSSKLFNGYYLGHLNPNDINEVEVLAGAFILTTKNVLKEVGGFDERYFMYAEDIDLCYTIRKTGRKIVYYPNTSIIHFKGESTKRSGLRYNTAFYKSMVLFMKKYEGDLYSSLSVKIYGFVIFLMGSLSFFWRKLKGLFLFVLAFFVLYSVQFFLTREWAQLMHDHPLYYPRRYCKVLLPVYVLFWLGSYFVYHYFKRGSLFVRLVKSQFYATILLIIIYNFLPLDWRFSRILLPLGALLNLLFGLFIFVCSKILQRRSVSQIFRSKDRAILVGNLEGDIAKKIEIQDVIGRHNVVGVVNNNGVAELETGIPFLGSLSEIDAIVDREKINLVYFMMDDMTFELTLDLMSKIVSNVEFRLIKGDKAFGSKDKDARGEFMTLGVAWKLNDPINQRLKRIMDCTFGIVLFLFVPFSVFLKKEKHIFRIILNLLSGRNSLVGFKEEGLRMRFKKGVLNFGDNISSSVKKEQYIQNYSPLMDVKIFLRNWRHLFINKIEP